MIDLLPYIQRTVLAVPGALQIANMPTVRLGADGLDTSFRLMNGPASTGVSQSIERIHDAHAERASTAKTSPSPPSSHLVPPSSCSLLLSIYSPQSVFTPKHYTPCPVALSRLPCKQSPASIELSNSTSKQQYNTPCVPSHTNYTSRTPIPTNARLLPSALATLRQSSPI